MDEEYDEILRKIVVIPAIHFAELISELTFCVVGDGGPLVLVGHAKSILIEHDADDSVYRYAVARSSGSVDLARAGERVIGTGSLPVRK